MIEWEAKERGLTHNERGQLRDSRCPMILHRLHRRLSQESITALPKSDLGKACTYGLGLWTELTRYAQPGRARHPAHGPWLQKLALRGPPGRRLDRRRHLLRRRHLQAAEAPPEAYLNWVFPQLAAATNHTAVSLLPHDYVASVKEQRP